MKISTILERVHSEVIKTGHKEMNSETTKIYEAAKKDVQKMQLLADEYANACMRILDTIEDAVERNGGKYV